MRKLTWVMAVMLCSVPALADKTSAATAEVKDVLDRADEAMNNGNAKILAGLCDSTFFYGGATQDAKNATLASARADMEKMFAKGPIGSLTRGETTIKVSDGSDVAWYIAEYQLIPKVAPGMLPMHKKLRESGVLVKRGKEWKLAMVHQAAALPEPRPAVAQPAPATPATK